MTLRIGIWPDHGYGVLPVDDESRLVFALTSDFTGFVNGLAAALSEKNDKVELCHLDQVSGLHLKPILFRFIAACLSGIERVGHVGEWFRSRALFPGAIGRIASFPLRVLQRCLLRLQGNIRLSVLDRAQAAGCDLWLIPAERRDAEPGWVGLVDWAVTLQNLLLPAAPPALPWIANALPCSRPFLLVQGTPQPGQFYDALLEARDLLPSKGVCGPVEVVFLGTNNEPAERAGLFRQAIATILPSLGIETFQVICEAMHAGCPLVCARVPALVPWVEVFGDTVPLFHPHHAESIAQAVQRIAEDRDWSHSLQLQAGRALWERSWQETAEDLLQLARRRRQPADFPGPEVHQGDPSRSNLQTCSGR